jgi:aminoglycoside 3-N-acetyltransferase I
MTSTQIKISRLSHENLNDFISLIKIFEQVFEMEDLVLPNYNLLKKLLENEKFVVFVAKVNGQVVAGLTAYILDSYYTNNSQIYLYDLGVNSNYQRQGIGTMLMANLINFAKSINIDEIFVQADSEDENAINFYRKTKAKEQSVIHFTYLLK